MDAADPVAEPAPRRRARLSTEPHKVLLFIPHLEQGGAERQILELMNRLPPRYAPTLCIYDRPHESGAHYQDYLPKGEPRHILGVSDMGPVGLARLVKILAQERPTILHSYRDTANVWARLAVKLAPVPIVVTSCRNQNILLRHAVAEKLLQHTSDRVLANSRGVRHELIDRAGVPPEKIQIIHNFLDLEKFRPPSDEERDAARARFGLAPDDVAVILPGRLSLQKHQLGLAAAIRILAGAGKLSPKVKFLLAGRASDFLGKVVVPRWVSLLGVERYVQFLGPLKDIVPLYHAADLLVMPSLYEGLSNAVLEGHACGLPQVVSRAADVDEIVEDGVTGLRVPTLDPRPLADALGRLIALPTVERRRMGGLGRARVEAQFHPDRILAEFVDLYDSLLDEKGLA